MMVVKIFWSDNGYHVTMRVFVGTEISMTLAGTLTIRSEEMEDFSTIFSKAIFVKRRS